MTFGSGCPTLVNDKELSRCCEIYAKELLGPEKAFSVEELNAMGGEAAPRPPVPRILPMSARRFPLSCWPWPPDSRKRAIAIPAPPYGEVR